MLYQGDFFSSEDRQVMAAVQEAAADQLSGFRGQFRDPRLPEMLFRFRARNYPESLTQDETERWQEFVQTRANSRVARERKENLKALLQTQSDDPVLQDLKAYFGE